MSKFRNINHSALERAHFLRIEQYAKAVDAIYNQAIREFSSLSSNINFNPKKPFYFEDYPGAYQKSKALFSEMASAVTATILKGDKDEWLQAASNNDRLVDAIFGSSRIGRKRLEQYRDRNLEALKSFQNRKSEGMTLSERVWKQTQQFKSEIEMGIDIGLGEGKSAAALSRDLRQNLQDPERLFRRVRDKHGALHLSKNAESYHPGQGVYRSSYKNAMRLTRTEINMAYRESDYHRWQQMDFIIGMEIRLSNNPNHCPMCAALAGKYPKDFKFTGWHPQCRCSAIPIMKSDDDMADDIMSILNDEPVGMPDEADGAITDMPANYKKWMSDNNQRILDAKSTPYFIRDNYVGGDVGKGLRFVVSEKVAEPSIKSIDLSKFIKGDVPTNKEIKNVLLEYAKQNPDDFRIGLEDVKFIKSRSYMMQHSAKYRPKDNTWVGQSKITISTNPFMGGTFNPAEELRSAFASIKKGQDLTFNQEYSIESLWHEILHAKTKTPPARLSRAGLKSMETVNQFTARHTYDDFLKALGGKATHKDEILEKGYGYSSWITDFRKRLKDAGIDEKTALDKLTPVLMSDYSKVDIEVFKFFRDNRK